jgi:hypothetical protein
MWVPSLVSLLSPHSSLHPLQNISIGLVIREGRRKIHNEAEFISLIHRAGLEWCQNRSIGDVSTCRITVPRIIFGKPPPPPPLSPSSWSSIEQDIQQIQLLSVLIGLQGSGLINGLYLSSFTSVVVYYLNDDWPISSGDPLEYLSARGPYLRYVNTDPDRVICPLTNDKVSLS